MRLAAGYLARYASLLKMRRARLWPEANLALLIISAWLWQLALDPRGQNDTLRDEGFDVVELDGDVARLA